MDGSTVGEIARHSWHDLHAAGIPGRECSPAEVRRVLEEEPPEEVMDDLRYVHGVRAFWIAANGELDGDLGTAPGMIYAFQPWRLTSKAFQKGVRAICRDFRDKCPAGDVNPQVIEGIEMDVALRMIKNRNVPAWIVSEDGEVVRYAGEFQIDEDEAPELPTP